MRNARQLVATAVLVALASTTAAAAPNATPAKGNPPAVPSAQTSGASQPDTTSQLPDYRINPGDQLNIQVFGEQSLTQLTTVSTDGTIEYPLIGRLRVAGDSPSQAADSLRTALLRYMKHPDVTVAVVLQGQANVLVLGNVKTPGKYPVRSGARITDAIAAAGGLGPTNGELPQARVTQPDGTLREVSLQTLLANGDAAQNLSLSDNAIVYVVGPLPIQVQVVGSVDHPGAIEVNQGDRLSSAIARAGTSANAKADLNHVVITHHSGNEQSKPIEVNMYEALKGGNLKYDPVLQKDDVVYVPMGRQNSPLNPLNLISRLIGL